MTCSDNVKEIYFKAYVDEKLEVHKKELEEGEPLSFMRFEVYICDGFL